MANNRNLFVVPSQFGLTDSDEEKNLQPGFAPNPADVVSENDPTKEQEASKERKPQKPSGLGILEDADKILADEPTKPKQSLGILEDADKILTAKTPTVVGTRPSPMPYAGATKPEDVFDDPAELADLEGTRTRYGRAAEELRAKADAEKDPKKKAEYEKRFLVAIRKYELLNAYLSPQSVPATLQRIGSTGGPDGGRTESIKALQKAGEAKQREKTDSVGNDIKDKIIKSRILRKYGIKEPVEPQSERINPDNPYQKSVYENRDFGAGSIEDWTKYDAALSEYQKAYYAEAALLEREGIPVGETLEPEVETNVAGIKGKRVPIYYTFNPLYKPELDAIYSRINEAAKRGDSAAQEAALTELQNFRNTHSADVSLAKANYGRTTVVDVTDFAKLRDAELRRAYFIRAVRSLHPDITDSELSTIMKAVGEHQLVVSPYTNNPLTSFADFIDDNNLGTFGQKQITRFHDEDGSIELYLTILRSKGPNIDKTPAGLKAAEKALSAELKTRSQVALYEATNNDSIAKLKGEQKAPFETWFDFFKGVFSPGPPGTGLIAKYLFGTAVEQAGMSLTRKGESAFGTWEGAADDTANRAAARISPELGEAAQYYQLLRDGYNINSRGEVTLNGQTGVAGNYAPKFRELHAKFKDTIENYKPILDNFIYRSRVDRLTELTDLQATRDLALKLTGEGDYLRQILGGSRFQIRFNPATKDYERVWLDSEKVLPWYRSFATSVVDFGNNYLPAPSTAIESSAEFGLVIGAGAATGGLGLGATAGFVASTLATTGVQAISTLASTELATPEARTRAMASMIAMNIGMGVVSQYGGKIGLGTKGKLTVNTTIEAADWGYEFVTNFEQRFFKTVRVYDPVSKKEIERKEFDTKAFFQAIILEGALNFWDWGKEGLELFHGKDWRNASVFRTVLTDSTGRRGIWLYTPENARLSFQELNDKDYQSFAKTFKGQFLEQTGLTAEEFDGLKLGQKNAVSETMAKFASRFTGKDPYSEGIRSSLNLNQRDVVFDPTTGKMTSLIQIARENNVSTEEEMRALFSKDGAFGYLNVELATAPLEIYSNNSSVHLLEAVYAGQGELTTREVTDLGTKAKQTLDKLVQDGSVYITDTGKVKITEEGIKTYEDFRKVQLEFAKLNLETDKSLKEEGDEFNQKWERDEDWHTKRNESLRKLGYNDEQIASMSAARKEELVTRGVNEKDFGNYVQKTTNLFTTQVANRLAAKSGRHKDAVSRYMNQHMRPVRIDAERLSKMSDAEKEVVSHAINLGLLDYAADGSIVNNAYTAYTDNFTKVSFGSNGYDRWLTFNIGKALEAGDTKTANRLLNEMARYTGISKTPEALSQLMDTVKDDYEFMKSNINTLEEEDNIAGKMPLKSKMMEAVNRRDEYNARNQQNAEDEAAAKTATGEEATEEKAPKLPSRTTQVKSRPPSQKKVALEKRPGIDFDWQRGSEVTGRLPNEFVVRDKANNKTEVFRRQADGSWQDSKGKTVTEATIRGMLSGENSELGTLKSEAPETRGPQDNAKNTLQEGVTKTLGPKTAELVNKSILSQKEHDENNKSLNAGEGTLNLGNGKTATLSLERRKTGWHHQDEFNFERDGETGRSFLNARLWKAVGFALTGKSDGVNEVNGFTHPSSKIKAKIAELLKGKDKFDKDGVSELDKKLAEAGLVLSTKDIETLEQYGNSLPSDETSHEVVVRIEPNYTKKIAAREGTTPHAMFEATIRHEVIHKIIKEATGGLSMETLFTPEVLERLKKDDGALLKFMNLMRSKGDKTSYGNMSLDVAMHELLAHGTDLRSIAIGLDIDIDNDEEFQTFIDAYNDVILALRDAHPDVATAIEQLSDPAVNTKIEELTNANRLSDIETRPGSDTELADRRSQEGIDGEITSTQRAVEETGSKTHRGSGRKQYDRTRLNFTVNSEGNADSVSFSLNTTGAGADDATSDITSRVSSGVTLLDLNSDPEAMAAQQNMTPEDFISWAQEQGYDGYFHSETGLGKLFPVVDKGPQITTPEIETEAQSVADAHEELTVDIDLEDGPLMSSNRDKNVVLSPTTVRSNHIALITGRGEYFFSRGQKTDLSKDSRWNAKSFPTAVMDSVDAGTAHVNSRMMQAITTLMFGSPSVGIAAGELSIAHVDRFASELVSRIGKLQGEELAHLQPLIPTLLKFAEDISGKNLYELMWMSTLPTSFWHEDSKTAKRAGTIVKHVVGTSAAAIQYAAMHGATHRNVSNVFGINIAGEMRSNLDTSPLTEPAVHYIAAKAIKQGDRTYSAQFSEDSSAVITEIMAFGSGELTPEIFSALGLDPTNPDDVKAFARAYGSIVQFTADHVGEASAAEISNFVNPQIAAEINNIYGNKLPELGQARKAGEAAEPGAVFGVDRESDTFRSEVAEAHKRSIELARSSVTDAEANSIVGVIDELTNRAMQVEHDSTKDTPLFSSNRSANDDLRRQEVEMLGKKIIRSTTGLIQRSLSGEGVKLSDVLVRRIGNFRRMLETGHRLNSEAVTSFLTDSEIKPLLSPSDIDAIAKFRDELQAREDAEFYVGTRAPWKVDTGWVQSQLDLWAVSPHLVSPTFLSHLIQRFGGGKFTDFAGGVAVEKDLLSLDVDSKISKARYAESLDALFKANPALETKARELLSKLSDEAFTNTELRKTLGRTRAGQSAFEVTALEQRNAEFLKMQISKLGSQGHVDTNFLRMLDLIFYGGTNIAASRNVFSKYPEADPHTPQSIQADKDAGVQLTADSKASLLGQVGNYMNSGLGVLLQQNPGLMAELKAKYDTWLGWAQSAEGLVRFNTNALSIVADRLSAGKSITPRNVERDEYYRLAQWSAPRIKEGFSVQAREFAYGIHQFANGGRIESIPEEYRPAIQEIGRALVTIANQRNLKGANIDPLLLKFIENHFGGRLTKTSEAGALLDGVSAEEADAKYMAAFRLLAAEYQHYEFNEQEDFELGEGPQPDANPEMSSPKYLEDMLRLSFLKWSYDNNPDFKQQADTKRQVAGEELPMYFSANRSSKAKLADLMDSNGFFDPIEAVLHGFDPLTRQPLAKKIPGIAKASDWLNILSAIPGIKKANIEWTDLKNRLMQNPNAKVTIDELRAYIADSKVKVLEYMPDEPMWADALDGSLILSGPHRDTSEMVLHVPEFRPGRTSGQNFTEADLPPHARVVVTNDPVYGPKFTVEHRLWIPTKQQFSDEYRPVKTSFGSPSGAIAAYLNREVKLSYRNDAHFRGVTNPVVHMRFDVRTDSTGKEVLHIDEIQSDLNQKLRHNPKITAAEVTERLKIQSKIDRLSREAEVEFQKVTGINYFLSSSGFGSKIEALFTLLDYLPQDVVSGKREATIEDILTAVGLDQEGFEQAKENFREQERERINAIKILYGEDSLTAKKAAEYQPDVAMKAIEQILTDMGIIMASQVSRLDSPSEDFTPEGRFSGKRLEPIHENDFAVKLMANPAEVVTALLKLQSMKGELDAAFKSWIEFDPKKLTLRTGEKREVLLPENPFETNWHELALKKLIQHALDNGITKLTWTTGLIQTERNSHGLRGVVSEIEYIPRKVADDKRIRKMEQAFRVAQQAYSDAKTKADRLEDRLYDPRYYKQEAQIRRNLAEARRAEYAAMVKRNKAEQAFQMIQVDQPMVMVTGRDKDGGTVFSSDFPADGTPIQYGTQDGEPRMVTLQSLLGKEMSDQILGSTKTGKLTGQQIAVGGEMYSRLYDQQIKKFLEKYMKGAKVEITKLRSSSSDPSQPPHEVWSIDMPQDFIDSVGEHGQPLFSSNRNTTPLLSPKEKVELKRSENKTSDKIQTDDVKRIVESGHFSLVSAKTTGMSARDAAAEMAILQEMLGPYDIRVVKAEGHYGESEPAFFLYYTNPAVARFVEHLLFTEFGQESVIHGMGGKHVIRFADGREATSLNTQYGTESGPTQLPDGTMSNGTFINIDGQSLSLNMEFGQPVQAAPYSYTAEKAKLAMQRELESKALKFPDEVIEEIFTKGIRNPETGEYYGEDDAVDYLGRHVGTWEVIQLDDKTSVPVLRWKDEETYNIYKRQIISFLTNKNKGSFRNKKPEFDALAQKLVDYFERTGEPVTLPYIEQYDKGNIGGAITMKGKASGQKYQYPLSFTRGRPQRNTLLNPQTNLLLHTLFNGANGILLTQPGPNATEEEKRKFEYETGQIAITIGLEIMNRHYSSDSDLNQEFYDTMDLLMGEMGMTLPAYKTAAGQAASTVFRSLLSSRTSLSMNLEREIYTVYAMMELMHPENESNPREWLVTHKPILEAFENNPEATIEEVTKGSKQLGLGTGPMLKLIGSTEGFVRLDSDYAREAIAENPDTPRKTLGELFPERTMDAKTASIKMVYSSKLHQIVKDKGFFSGLIPHLSDIKENGDTVFMDVFGFKTGSFHGGMSGLQFLATMDVWMARLNRLLRGTLIQPILDPKTGKMIGLVNNDPQYGRIEDAEYRALGGWIHTMTRMFNEQNKTELRPVHGQSIEWSYILAIYEETKRRVVTESDSDYVKELSKNPRIIKLLNELKKKSLGYKPAMTALENAEEVNLEAARRREEYKLLADGGGNHSPEAAPYFSSNRRVDNELNSPPSADEDSMPEIPTKPLMSANTNQPQSPRSAQFDAQQAALNLSEQGLRDGDPDAWVDVAQRMVTKGVLADSEVAAIRSLAEKGDIKGLQKYIVGLSKQSVLELLVNSGRVALLMGWRNIAKNFGGNTLRQFMDEVSRVPASAIDLVLMQINKAIGGTNFERGTTSILSHPLETLQAYKQALAKGLGQGARQFIDVLRGTDQNVVFEHPSLFRERTTGWRFLKPLEIFEKYGWRLQGAMDRPFNAVAYHRTLAELQSMRQKMEADNGNPISFEEAEDYLTVADYQLAEEYALHATYQKDNPIANKYYQLVDGLPPTWRAIITNVTKFVKTPLNVIDYVMDYTGFWPIIKMAHAEYGTKDWVDWKTTVKKVLDTPADRKTLSMAISRGAIGTMMYHIGMQLAASGILAGFFDKEEKKEGEQMEAKGTSYGKLQIGDVSVDISWLSPNAFYLIAGATDYKVKNDYETKLAQLEADLAAANEEQDEEKIKSITTELEKHKKSSPTDEAITRILKNLALQTPFLRQIDDIKTAYDQNRLGQGLAERWISPEAYVPAIVKELAGSTDEFDRVVSNEGVLATMRDRIQKNLPTIPGIDSVGKYLQETGIPLLSGLGKIMTGRKNLPVKYDMLGNPVANEGGLNPLKPTPVSSDLLVTELDRFNLSITKPEGATSEEVNRLRKEKGEYFKNLLNGVVNSESYAGLEDSDKKKVLESALRAITNNSKRDDDKKLSDSDLKLNLEMLSTREQFKSTVKSNPESVLKPVSITDKRTLLAFNGAGLPARISVAEILEDIRKSSDLVRFVNDKFQYELMVSEKTSRAEAEANLREFNQNPTATLIRWWAQDKRFSESSDRTRERRNELAKEGKSPDEIEKIMRKEASQRGVQTRRKMKSFSKIEVTR